MKKIKLTQGKSALVDDEDYNYLSQWKWLYTSSGYAGRRQRLSNGKDITILMHRVIMSCPDGLVVDHIDRNTLNNQKRNLRNCTHSENHINAPAHKNNQSGYRGVSWHKWKKKWRATITKDGLSHHLGYFENLEDANTAYLGAVQTLFSSFINRKGK